MAWPVTIKENDLSPCLSMPTTQLSNNSGKKTSEWRTKFVDLDYGQNRLMRCLKQTIILSLESQSTSDNESRISLQDTE